MEIIGQIEEATHANIFQVRSICVKTMLDTKVSSLEPTILMPGTVVSVNLTSNDILLARAYTMVLGGNNPVNTALNVCVLH